MTKPPSVEPTLFKSRKGEISRRQRYCDVTSDDICAICGVDGKGVVDILATLFLFP